MSESFDPDKVICDYWKTPLLDSKALWLERQLYTGYNNYFFFTKNGHVPKSPIHILSIRWGDTFKISEEGEGMFWINRLLKNKKPSRRKRGRTFKVWNSQLALEVTEGMLYPEAEYRKMEKFQYVVLAQDESIEFVTYDEPKWELHHGMSLNDAVTMCLERDCPE